MSYDDPRGAPQPDNGGDAIVVEKHRHRSGRPEEVSFYACGPVRPSIDDARRDALMFEDVARVRAAQRVAEVYFDIAAAAIGEDEVRRRRDAVFGTPDGAPAPAAPADEHWKWAIRHVMGTIRDTPTTLAPLMGITDDQQGRLVARMENLADGAGRIMSNLRNRLRGVSDEGVDTAARELLFLVAIEGIGPLSRGGKGCVFRALQALRPDIAAQWADDADPHDLLRAYFPDPGEPHHVLIIGKHTRRPIGCMSDPDADAMRHARNEDPGCTFVPVDPDECPLCREDAEG